MGESAQLLIEIGERISRNENKKKGFTLLYEATEKADVEEFHRSCDAKGPTVTILHGKHNTLFGGYTSKDWSSAKMQVKDEDAFLFTKNEHKDAKCIFFPIKEKQTHKAIMCDKFFGPTFGVAKSGKHDLQTFKKDSKPESKEIDGYMKLNGSLEWNKVFAVEKKVKDNEGNQNKNAACDVDQFEYKASAINSGLLIVKRIEVYQVTDDEFEKNWLERLEGDSFEQKKTELIEMELLPGFDINHYNILLLGFVGAGKSSFINTLSTVFTKKLVPIAQSRQSSMSVTNKVHKYILQSENGDTLKIRIVDMRGIESGRRIEKELELLIDGRLPEDYQFPDEPKDDIVERQNPTLNDKIHLICFVEGNPEIDKYPNENTKQINDIKHIIGSAGLPMIVIATKFDMLCPKILKNVDHLFKSPKARQAVVKIADFYGVSQNQVLPVVNYIGEETTLKAKDELALKALYKIWETTEGYLKHHKERKIVRDSWTAREDEVLPFWRDDNEKRKLLTDKLTDFDNKDIRILLVGPVDSGKSSFIDSVISTIRGKVVFEASRGFARAKTDDPFPTTEKFKLYQVEYVDNNEIARRSGIRLGDTPGFQEKDGIKEDHVNLIINGSMPDGYKIINGSQVDNTDQQRDRAQHDKIHCVCFVFDCEKIQKKMTGNMKDLMTSMLRSVDDKGCPRIVLLTKCDKVSQSWQTGQQRIFEDRNVKKCKEILMDSYGFKQQQIYPIVNYDDQNVVEKQIDRLILAAFFECLVLGKSHMSRVEKERQSENEQ